MAGSLPGTADPLERARRLFLDDANTYGCAEVTMLVLEEHFSLPGAGDSSAAMALNGGVAYSGGPCGAVTGAALVIGRLAGSALADHIQAKSQARRLVQQLMEAFVAEFGSAQCRTLTGYDLLAPGGHAAFIESGVWREACMRQILFAVDRSRQLVEAAPWYAPPTIRGGPAAAAGADSLS